MNVRQITRLEEIALTARWYWEFYSEWELDIDLS